MNCLCRPSRTISVRIVLLDDTDFTHEIKDDLPGQALLDVVFARLNLIETAYFGLRYLDEENQTHWLDSSNRLSRQLKTTIDIYNMYFGVKFYAADPTKLIEEITRYQLFLQVKQDVLQGRLPVSFELAAELGAFIVQSELGDYDSRRHSTDYVSEFSLLPNQSTELENRVAELHQQLNGMTPAIAELNYLDKVKWHDMYGVDLHPVLGEDSVEYYLGLTPSGIVVLRNKTTVAYYYWPRIVKVYFKGKYFMLRVCDKNNDVNTYGFETPRKIACRHLWRCCVEHHAFFRLVCVSPMKKQQQQQQQQQQQSGTDGRGSDFFSFRSKFRYSSSNSIGSGAGGGKPTDGKHIGKDNISGHSRTPPNFKRMPSKRQPRRSSITDQLNGSNSIAGSKSFDANSFSKRNQSEIKSISIPQLAQAFDSPYRSTCNVPTSLTIRQYPMHGNGATPDSPRSTRSAPWPPRTQQKGLFGVTASPRSVRSVNSRKLGNGNSTTSYRFRSNSVESHSSNESKSCRRHKHRKRQTSDNESELSRGSCSGRSNRSHNSRRKHRRQRSKHRRNESECSDPERNRSSSTHCRKTSVSMERMEPNLQWRDGGSSVQHSRYSSSVSTIHQSLAAPSTSTKNASSRHSSSNENDSHSYSSSHQSHHRSRRHKKNRSPSDGRSRIWYNELAKHLEFDLVDTAGMTEDQLREIPYKKVETQLSKRTSSTGTASAKVHKSNGAKDRVDRIRGIYLTESNSMDPATNGSIRSASTLSSKDCDKNSSLVRMMSSLSMGDFVSPSGSCLTPLDETGLRVSHEHTDSGLGADQDYAYSSERSSDSTKYGTNKSSGTSVTSNGNHNNHKSSLATQVHNASISGTVHDSVSSGKPPIHPHSQRSSFAPPTVHSSCSNNRLYNNTHFQNNQYTFSLNRSTGDGYLDIQQQQEQQQQQQHREQQQQYHQLQQYQRPFSAASLFTGDGSASRSRGTKSDIGAPTNANRRHGSTVKSFGVPANSRSNIDIKSKIPSVKSDFLLSYLQSHSQNQNMMMMTMSESSELPTPSMPPIPPIQSSSQSSQSSSSQSAYHISDIINYNNFKYKSMGDHHHHHHHHQSSKANKTQKIQRNLSTVHSSSNQTHANVGPLLYLDNAEYMNNKRTKSCIAGATSNVTAQMYHQSQTASTGNHNPCSDAMPGARLTEEQTQTDNTSKTPHRSTSLELILTPIIQSSRRAQ